MASSNEHDSASNLPRHLRKDPAKQRQRAASRFNFSWIGGMAQRLRSALRNENRAEAQSVRRQSEEARQFRLSEPRARRSGSLATFPPAEHATPGAKSSHDASQSDGLTPVHSRADSQAESPAVAHASQNGGQSAAVVPHNEKSPLDQPHNALASRDVAGAEATYEAATALDSLLRQSDARETRETYAEYSYGEDYEADSAEQYGEGADGTSTEDVDAADEDVEARDERSDEGSVVEMYADDAEDLDADDLDAEDLDADDLDADVMDVDAEDVDADDMDSEDLENLEEGENKGAGAVCSDADRTDTEANDPAQHEFAEDLDSDSGHAPVAPSDHEAHDYDPELSSMSLWEGAGFQSYDSAAMAVDYEGSGLERHDADMQSDVASQHDSDSEVRHGTKSAPLANYLDSEPPVALDQQDALPPLAHSITSHPPSLSGAGEPQSSTLPAAGSRLEPSKRYLGFHFGPAPDAATRASATRASASLRTSHNAEEDNSKAVVEPQRAEPATFRDMRTEQATAGLANGTGGDTNGTGGDTAHKDSTRSHLASDVAPADVGLQPLDKARADKEVSEDQYAGLWNLFNVGFTVAPQPEPVKRSSGDYKPSAQYLHQKKKSVVAEPSFEDEFRLLTQAAHRVMAGSTLFGGAAPAVPKHPRTSTDMPLMPAAAPEDQDPYLYNKRVSSIAHSIFANSSLFGFKQETSDTRPESHGQQNIITTDAATTAGQAFAANGAADTPVPTKDKNNDNLLEKQEDSDESLPPTKSNSTSLALDQPEDASSESDKKQPAKQASSKRAVKRRRLRKTASAGLTEADTAEIGEEAEIEAASLDEQTTESGQALEPEGRKRKRTERTRPLTRAALRAQKEKEAAHKAEDAQSESDAESSKKNRRSAVTRKPGASRRTGRKA